LNYLLDTCVVSEMIKPNPNQKVIQWIEEKDEKTLFLSVLTIGELWKGISKLPESKKKEEILLWMKNDLRQRFKKRILKLTEETAKVWGEIQGKAEKEGKKLPAIDSLLAATAIFHSMILVTRNVPNTEIETLSIINPWEI